MPLKAPFQRALRLLRPVRQSRRVEAIQPQQAPGKMFSASTRLRPISYRVATKPGLASAAMMRTTAPEIE
jgi:hypothetical protein